jgi:hypothetical protein
MFSPEPDVFGNAVPDKSAGSPELALRPPSVPLEQALYPYLLSLWIFRGENRIVLSFGAAMLFLVIFRKKPFWQNR